MAIVTIKEEQVPLKAYLRADSYSQHFRFNNNTGEGKELVTDEMFWGETSMSDDSIYLDYSLIKNRKIEITEGISHNKGSQTLRNEDCDEWILENILNLEETKMFVIQGYAGCGKTTFMNNLSRRNTTSRSFYIDIGRDWTYQQEPYMFFNEVLGAFDLYIEEIIGEKRTRKAVWQKFIEMGSELDIKQLDLELPNIIPKFINIKENCKWNSLRTNLHEYLNETYNGKYDSSKRNSINNENDIWHNWGQTQTLVSLLTLIICARFLAEKETGLREKSYNLIFDNLDIITNPAIPAENVVSLWGVIQRFTNYKNLYKKKTQNDLPNIRIFITARKVLYSHITSHLPDLEMLTNYNPYLINVCDISGLYNLQDILNHRISYWKRHIDDEEIIEKLRQLGELTKIHDNMDYFEYNKCLNNENDYTLKSTINLDAIFNHNYRAFSNVISIFLENNKFTKTFLPDFSINSISKGWQKVATLVFEISLLYRSERVWNKMGFGCSDFDSIDYPTTLNRLILNYLYVSKCGQALRSHTKGCKDIPINDRASLKELLELFTKVKFITVDSRQNKEQINENYNAEANMQTRELVLERLADMCARNPGSYHTSAYGYNSDDDELWRRPLYFVGGVKLNHTATSDRELKAYFEQCLDNNKADQILFSITDEGFILIRDIVASFEFYSARYCKDTLVKTLHQVTSENEINLLIQPVYNAIKLCCERHNFFMDQYMQQYKLDKNKYLRQRFHPRTNPRFDENDNLTKASFRPQLHIVRVIYAHVAYFNEVKKLLSESQFSDKNAMCECLSGWIKNYLLLYKNNFYDVLKNTVCNSDNNVFGELNKLINEQMQHYGNGGDQKNINIGNM